MLFEYIQCLTEAFYGKTDQMKIKDIRLPRTIEMEMNIKVKKSKGAANEISLGKFTWAYCIQRIFTFVYISGYFIISIHTTKSYVYWNGLLPIAKSPIEKSSIFLGIFHEKKAVKMSFSLVFFLRFWYGRNFKKQLARIGDVQHWRCWMSFFLFF